MRSCFPRDWDVAALTQQEGFKEYGYNHGRNLAHGQVSNALQAWARQQIACTMANFLTIRICYPLSACSSLWRHVVRAGLSNFGPWTRA